MRTLKTKLLFLLIAAALTPLIIFGVLSLYNYQRSLRASIQESYGEITVRASEEIGLFLNNSREILETLALDLVDTGLTRTQSERIIENYAIRFPQFLKLLVYTPDGELTFSTSLQKSDTDLPPEPLVSGAKKGGFAVSRQYLSEDLTPVIWFLVPMRSGPSLGGILAAQVDLMQMWKWVSDTRLGEQGYVSVVDENRAIVASGNPFYKKKILSTEEPVYLDFLSLKDSSGGTQVLETSQGLSLVSVQLISDHPKWYLLLAQPVSEAFAAVRTTTWFLVALIVLFLGIMILVGTLGSRRTLLKPVGELMKATRAIGRGDLSYRISDLGKDELGQLGQSFNQMSEELIELQEMTRRQERLAMFGRIASGLAHDLKHPVKNIENASRLMDTHYQDPEYRKTFNNIVKREFSRINQFLEDLRNLTHEMSFHPVPLDVEKLLEEILESFQGQAEEKGARLNFIPNGDVPSIRGDPNLLRRLFENIISNGLQAVPRKGGLVEVGLHADGSEVRVQVQDNGPGIPPERLPGLFEEFTTTKGRGLGLGLAIAKKIISLHGGKISVESELKKCTMFILTLPQNLG